MRDFRRHIVVRLVVCVLLTWTAVDLLVPQWCDAEEFSQSAAQDQSEPTRADDCFCCSHVVDPVRLEVVFADGVPVLVETFPADDLAPGVPRTLYHPPLLS